MPYIAKRRKEFDEIINQLPVINNKGELEYIIFKTMKLYMKQVNREYRYSTLHDVVYAIQHCADEFRRRYLDKRENEAIELNGDID